MSICELPANDSANSKGDNDSECVKKKNLQGKLTFC